MATGRDKRVKNSQCEGQEDTSANQAQTQSGKEETKALKKTVGNRKYSVVVVLSRNLMLLILT